jgi:hypothetical protein
MIYAIHIMVCEQETHFQCVHVPHGVSLGTKHLHVSTLPSGYQVPLNYLPTYIVTTYIIYVHSNHLNYLPTYL